MATNISETLRYLSQLGTMREAERIRRSSPETLLNIASTLEQLKGVKQQREFGAQREPFIQSSLESGALVSREAFDYDQATKQLRKEFPEVVEKYGDYSKGDKSIKDAGLNPNPFTRTMQGLIESGQNDLAMRIDEGTYKTLTGGLPQSVRAARERGTQQGLGYQARFQLENQSYNNKLRLQRQKQSGNLKEIEYRTLNNINEFLLKISQGEVQIPLLLDAMKATEKMVDDYGSQYRPYAEKLRSDYESYESKEITAEQLQERLIERYNEISNQLDEDRKSSEIDIKTGEPKVKEEETTGEFDLTDKEMSSLPTISAGGKTWRQVIRGGISYIYAPNSKKPAFQVNAAKWGSLSNEQKAKVLTAKGF